MKYIDTSSELILQRWRDGIRLLRPDKFHLQEYSDADELNKYRLGSIFQLPFNVYFLDTDSTLQNSSIEHAQMMGFTSVKPSIGLSVFDMVHDAHAKKIRHTDMAIINSRRMNIIEEDAIIKTSEIYQQSLSLKFPWYDDEDKVTGVFGYSVIIGKHNLAYALKQISEVGLLHSGSEQSGLANVAIDGVHLSSRERECLSHLVKGKTAKEIGRAMNMSNRTAEYYLASIKMKLNVSSKSELIQKVIDYFQNY